ncbi:hypothetical protein M408DRAFT_332726 [Serendipita vermifera MAFF 305830]|uniref:Het-C-domain-containing protein n=1 Tax=Serendipita vermifera MAFF 305830 TaxID=933852 RepID=A0A0C2WZZ2_SERVB|nr:hypothetical protein M408DRAFT_332726 [Serendipita vermifera MAFF 305830]
MPSFWKILLILGLISYLPLVTAFGAGHIPDFAAIKGKSFRHGDIEHVLSRLLKSHVGQESRGMMEAAASFLGGGGSGSNTFTTADIKRIYFGNWLRDYSQAMDLAGLQKMTKETIIMVLSVLSFMTFGYATEEYELTAPRVGVYLPVEHIDNPKGYAEKEGDPRQFHPWLRPPVHEQELEIDLRTGMKNYIASEGNFWDTSTACVRRNLGRGIELARACQLQDGPTLFEAYRLLGTGLHTLEDLLAHSNWVELTLIKFGYGEVFAYVGEDVCIDSPRGRIAPLVTGTFGSADFMFSVMSEGSDKISQNSLDELQQNFSNTQGNDGSIDTIKSLLSQLPSSGGKEDKVQQGEQMKQNAIHFDPNNYTSQETQAQIWQALCWRDDIMRDIESIIAGIPGLEELVDQISQALTVYIYSIIQPYIMPYLKQISTVLTQQSKAVVDEDKTQFEVFEDPLASDPTHSMLSKDHFDNILNEPAGRVAQVVVEHAVNLVVAAWSDPGRDIGWTLNEINQAFHHPHFMNPQSPVQLAMERALLSWFQEMRPDEQGETLRRLRKDSIRHGKNKRLDLPDDTPLRHDHSQSAYTFESRPAQHGPVYYGDSAPAPGHYMQNPAMGGYGAYMASSGPPMGYPSPSSQGSGGYDGRYNPPMNSGSGYEPSYNTSPGYTEHQNYGQPSYEQYSPPPQHSGGGGMGSWAGVAAGGLAGLAGGVILAEEGDEIEENIEEAVEEVQDFYDM